MSQTTDAVIIYTDGACSGNPGPGGWGAIFAFWRKRKGIVRWGTGYHQQPHGITGCDFSAFGTEAPVQSGTFLRTLNMSKNGITQWDKKVGNLGAGKQLLRNR